MKKQLMNKGTSKLARAKAEFEQFKRKQSKNIPLPATQAPEQKQKTALTMPKMAHQTLYCSKNAGKSSRLDFELSETTARGIKATPINKGSSGAGPKQSQDMDALILKRKVTMSGSYDGCPYCSQSSFCRCGSCGAISCIASGTDHHTCPNCKKSYNTVPLTDAIDLCGNRTPEQQALTSEEPRPALTQRKRKAIAQKERKGLPHKLAGLLPKK